MIKRIVCLACLLMLLALTALSAAAELIPEKNPIGETVRIEPDENLIRDNIVQGNPDESFAVQTDRVISMDRSAYIKTCLLPLLLLAGTGLAVFAVSELGRKFRQSSNPSSKAGKPGSER